MNSFVHSLPGNLRRNPLMVLGFALLFAIAAYEAAGLVNAGDPTGLALATMAIVVLALVIAFLNHWRRGLRNQED